jgi:hypothetical protein
LLNLLDKNNSTLYNILKNSSFAFEPNKITINLEDLKYIDKLDQNNTVRELQELIYEYFACLYTIEFRSNQKKYSLDERKKELKNNLVVKSIVEKYNAVIEKIEIF